VQGVVYWMAESWLQLWSVTVRVSWIKLLRIQAEGDVAQYGECENLRSVLLQLSRCENTEKIVLRKNDSTEMISTK
jgi:hypothetical protein